MPRSLYLSLLLFAHVSAVVAEILEALPYQLVSVLVDFLWLIQHATLLSLRKWKKVLHDYTIIN